MSKVHRARGLAAYRRSDYQAAIETLQPVWDSGDRTFAVASALGAALNHAGRHQDALPCLQTAHRLRSGDSAVMTQCAECARMLGKAELAVEMYEAAAQLGDRSTFNRFGAAKARLDLRRWLEAVHILEQLHRENPADFRAAHNLGYAWRELGESDRAMGLFKEAMAGGEMPPLIAAAVESPHAPGCSAAELLQYRKALAARLAEEQGEGIRCAIAEGRLKALPQPNGVTRIGFVSAFFDKANWMKPVWALLNNLDREEFSVFLFSDRDPDAVAEGYRPHPADEWIDIRGKSNAGVAGLCASCSLDVLVDLNGYSAIERLGLFSIRPAPVRDGGLVVGWFNHYATSALPAIDLLIGDPVVHPPGSDTAAFTEQVGLVTHTCLAFDFAYPSAPVTRVRRPGEPFTFGCLGSAYKITPQVRDAWAEILRRVPHAHLLVRNRLFDRADHQAWFLRNFEQQGVDTRRIRLLGPADHAEFLATYAGIDLVLDTFPYSGGTTTMEALWQGVPVICQRGDRWVTRTTASLLAAAGLHAFVGDSLADYLELAVLWASPSRQPELAGIRENMRQRLADSPACDGKSLARDFSRLIRTQMRFLNRRP